MAALTECVSEGTGHPFQIGGGERHGDQRVAFFDPALSIGHRPGPFPRVHDHVVMAANAEQDDGIGMEEEQASTILTNNDQIIPEGHTHIGLKNVDRRIRMYYGEENPVTITSKPGEGTAVTICIPMQENSALHTMNAAAQN